MHVRWNIYIYSIFWIKTLCYSLIGIFLFLNLYIFFAFWQLLMFFVEKKCLHISHEIFHGRWFGWQPQQPNSLNAYQEEKKTQEKSSGSGYFFSDPDSFFKRLGSGSSFHGRSDTNPVWLLALGSRFLAIDIFFSKSLSSLW